VPSVIAVNLNGDIVGRYATDNHQRTADRAPGAPPEFVQRLVNLVPTAWREHASAILPKLVSPAPTSPGYFEVLMTSINVMQDQITRARLAGKPPHVMLVPRLGQEINRAEETISEERAVVAHALPLLKRYI
jgi:NTE family protein